MPKIISIEGNIGAGKTTILEHLEKMYKDDDSVQFLREPVHIWESIADPSGENILQKFYKDPAKHAFTFQVMAFVTRLSLLRQVVKDYPDCKLIICERSLEADKHIFAKMLFDDGVIENINYQIYLKFYEEYKNDFQLDGVVYIDADADICSKRIKRRARQGEEGVALDYLINCQKYHDEWLTSDLLSDKILTIKTNEDVSFENDGGVLWLERINKYITSITKEPDLFSQFMDMMFDTMTL